MPGRLGVPRRGGRRRRRGAATRRTARPPCASSSRGGGVEVAEPRTLVTFSRWITPEMVTIRFDTHFFLALAPAHSAAARSTAARCVDVGWFAPAGRARDAPRRRAAARLPDDQAPRAARRFATADGGAGRTRAAARSSRSSRRWSARARSGAIVLPGEPGYEDYAARVSFRHDRHAPPRGPRVFDRFITTEYTTVDAGQPITWPVTPYYRAGAASIDVTTGLGYPKKADDARATRSVALLFSDPTGRASTSGPGARPGTAKVDDADLDANRDRYVRESGEKLPATKEMQPPEADAAHVRLVLRADLRQRAPRARLRLARRRPRREPKLFDAHMEEVRSGHVEEPAEAHGSAGRRAAGLGRAHRRARAKHDTAVLARWARRLPVLGPRPASRATPREGRSTSRAEPAGLPLLEGLACVTAHDHAPEFKWQRNFQVRGDLEHRRAAAGCWCPTSSSAASSSPRAA